MAALSRIEYGLTEEEFWRMTPRQMYHLSKRHAEREKRTLDLFRFLATVTARSAGNDVNYMEDAESDSSEGSGDNWGTLEAFLKSRATNGATDKHRPEESPRTPEGDEAHGDGDRAEGR